MYYCIQWFSTNSSLKLFKWHVCARSLYFIKPYPARNPAFMNSRYCLTIEVFKTHASLWSSKIHDMIKNYVRCLESDPILLDHWKVTLSVLWTGCIYKASRHNRKKLLPSWILKELIQEQDIQKLLAPCCPSLCLLCLCWGVPTVHVVHPENVARHEKCSACLWEPVVGFCWARHPRFPVWSNMRSFAVCTFENMGW